MTILVASRRLQRRRRMLLLALRFATPIRGSRTGSSVPAWTVPIRPPNSDQNL